MRTGTFSRTTAALMMSLFLTSGAAGQDLPGVTDNEIRIGNISPYTGPAAGFSTIARTQAAFFEMLNDAGGINGRSIRFISYDDGYAPPRTLEQARRLVEADDVLLIFQSLGTGPNLAIRDYLNEAGVPQLFIATGATFFDDPAQYRWTMPFTPSYQAEATAYANHIIETLPEAIVGILYQDDDFGRDYLTAIIAAIGDALPIVAQPYAVSDTNVDAQIAALRDSGATVLVSAASIRTTAQAIRRAAELSWSPQHYVASVSSGIEDTLEPAGLQNAIGVITARYVMDPTDPAFEHDADMQAFLAFMETYDPGTGAPGGLETYAFAAASALVEVLRRCGDDLSRENVMRQAASLNDLIVPLLLPGITVTTSADDYAPIEEFGLGRFDGNTYVLIGAEAERN